MFQMYNNSSSSNNFISPHWQHYIQYKIELIAVAENKQTVQKVNNNNNLIPCHQNNHFEIVQLLS